MDEASDKSLFPNIEVDNSTMSSRATHLADFGHVVQFGDDVRGHG